VHPLADVADVLDLALRPAEAETDAGTGTGSPTLVAA
jgi:hypothetical protein